MNNTTAFQQGYEAFELRNAVNPYDRRADQRAWGDWNRGYIVRELELAELCNA